MLWCNSGENRLFAGQFDHAIDDKGRVSIPSRFRDVLQAAGHSTLMITNNYISGEPCLDLYPPDEWAKLIGRLNERPRFDPDIQAFETFYIAGAHELQVDRQGRILIPNRLREHARLQRDVVFSAKHSIFQLWTRELLDKVRQHSIELMKSPEFHAKLGI